MLIVVRRPALPEPSQQVEIRQKKITRCPSTVAPAERTARPQGAQTTEHTKAVVLANS